MASNGDQTCSKVQSKVEKKSETYIDGLQNEARKRYKAKLNLIGADNCPYEELEEKWLEDPSQWPDLTYPYLYHYLIKTPSKSYLAFIYILVLQPPSQVFFKDFVINNSISLHLIITGYVTQCM